MKKSSGREMEIVGIIRQPPEKRGGRMVFWNQAEIFLGGKGEGGWTEVEFLVVVGRSRNTDGEPGLPTLSSHQLVVQFIYSFVLTVVATLIEPVWVVITRFLALYQPWTELSRAWASRGAASSHR